MNDREYATPAELAAYLRVSERTVARMVADGCPSILPRGRRRFRVADVVQWMESRACQPEKTPKADGTPKRASLDAAFIDASRSVRLRVMPSGSKPS